jgi:NADH-quinone oxidoreductase subunit L
MGLAVAAATTVIYFTYLLFVKNRVLPAEKEDQMKPWQKLIYNKYFIDEIYDAVIRRPLEVLSLVFHKFIDIQIIDGIVNGVGSSVKFMGSGVRLIQRGNIGFYVISMVLGIVLVLLLTFII